VRENASPIYSREQQRGRESNPMDLPMKNFSRSRFAACFWDWVRDQKENQRVRESKPISTFRKLAQCRRKSAPVRALTASNRNAAFARFAQNYAVRVSEFVRKRFPRVGGDGNIASRDRAAILDHLSTHMSERSLAIRSSSSNLKVGACCV
jgi:hypothetical protein